MKLESKSLSNSASNRHFKLNQSAKANEVPVYKDNDISFKGYDFTKTVDKINHTITYSNVGEISQKIDKFLGDNYFTNTIRKANLTINPDNTLKIKDTTILKDIWRTVKYPFSGMPLDFANWVAKGMKKVPLLKGLGKSIQALPLLQKRANAQEVEKSFEAVNDILNSFADAKVLGKARDGITSFDSEKCLEKFKTTAANKLVNTAKNYSSRDERTLNRMVTSTVSALYGAADFHNISMLQKDDKNEAKKAGKGRFKQEMLRMCFNAGTTFLTLGALDKYIKHSMAKSVLAIGASALLAEVVSRLISKTPLKRLTPKEAEKIALKNRPELAEALKIANNKEKNDRLNFKQRLEDTNKIFVQFQSKDGRFPAIKCLDDDYANAKRQNKKKLSPKKLILGAVGLASIGYIISSALKGKYKYRSELKKLYDSNAEAITQHLKNPEIPLSEDVADKLSKITTEYKSTSKDFSIFKKLKEAITTRNVDIDLRELSEKVEKIKNTPQGAQIKDILSQYFPEGFDATGKLKGKQDITLLKGLYEGFAKLFNTIYIVLSSPVNLVESILDKTVYRNSNEAVEIINNRLPKKVSDDEIQKLYSIFKKSGMYEPEGIKKLVYSVLNRLGMRKTNKTKIYETVAKEITKNSRNFKEGPATGDLANLSRTLVTAISTYFFVNDYTNKVLIESAGKDTQKAKEEQNQRLAHKASNFVFNGTLMNLFNSVFVKPLNRSLLGAALVAGATETTNEFLVRKSICQPVLPKDSRKEIIDYEEKQMSKKGLLGAWSRLYRKLTGKKSLTQKTASANKKVG